MIVVTERAGRRAEAVVPTQIRRTFVVIGETLAEAGAGWADVVESRSHLVRDASDA